MADRLFSASQESERSSYGTLIRRAPGGKLTVPPWCVAQVMGFVLGASLVYAVFRLSEADMPPLGRLEGPRIGAGETPFPLEAEGWLNGAAPSWSSLHGKVVVVDVWTDW